MIRPLQRVAPVALLLLLASPLAACGSKAPSDPDGLAREVFTLLQNDDFKGFASLALTQDDFDGLLARATFENDERRAKAAERGQKMVQRATANALKGWARVREKAQKYGIDWSEATYVRSEPRVEVRDGVEGGDIMLVFAFRGTEFKIKLDDCIKADRGWILNDDMRLRTPSSADEVKVEGAPAAPPTEAPADGAVAP